MVELARLESVYTYKGYQGFESPSFRKKINELQLLQKCCGSFFFVKYAYVFLLKLVEIERNRTKKRAKNVQIFEP